MGIKVEHQGNATSRIVGANVGGNAKARQERSLEMKRTAAVENAAANRQLDGARATGATPGHATAQLGHAQVGGGGGGKGGGTKGATAATSPTTATTPRRKYLGGPQWRPSVGFKEGEPQTFENMMGAGQYAPEGATGYDVDKGQFYRDYADGEYEQEQRAIAQQDALNLERQKLALKAENDLSVQGQKDMASLNKDIADAVMSGRFSQAEMEDLNRETDVAKKRIMFAEMYRQKEPTPAETFAKNTYTDQNGVVFDRNGTKMIYDPNAAQLKQQQAEDTRYQNALLKLGQGYTVTEQVEDGEDDNGNMTYKNVAVRKQYTPKEMDAMLEKMFPGRYPQPQGAPNVGTVQQTSVPVSTDAVVNKWASVFNGNGGATPSPAAQPTTQPQAIQPQVQSPTPALVQQQSQPQAAVPQLTESEQAELRRLFGIKDEPKPNTFKDIADFRKAKRKYKPYVYQGGANSVSFVNGTRR